MRLIIPMIIQTIGLDPSKAVWTESVSNLSSLDLSGADQIDAEHPARNRKVVGSNPTSGSTNQQVRAYSAPLRYVGVRPIDSLPVDGPPSSAHSGRNYGGRTIQPALRAGRAFARI
jgi:hypothetical protein